MTDLRQAIRSARQLHRAGGGGVLDILLRSSGLQGVALAERMRLEAGVEVLVDVAVAEADFTVLAQDAARSLACVPVRLRDREGLWLALADPWDEERLRQAAAALGSTPQPLAVPAAILEGWLGGAAETRSSAAAATGRADVGPVVEFVDTAIRAAFGNGASDIHFECDRSGVVVKFRQDGVMAKFARMDGAERAEEVISRIKVLAQLDITERRVPQDGRFRSAVDGRGVDLRVSIMPSVFGEDAVLRLLDKAQLRTRQDGVSLSLLGFDDDSAARLRDLAELPHGMLLVTGPTGSGKTTTVYAILSEINNGLEKIITIEDPVEYELPGVLQIPVNERKGLTFAKGLRSILRHDPDRILVGEIRDAETAEIAVQSALTGHQVFTTVHANSVFDVTGRFRHFDLDMFGFASSLNGVVVQRLVRRVCSKCVGVREPRAEERRWLESLDLGASTLPDPKGCDACHGTGYRGRSVVAEVHRIDDHFRDLITGAAPVSVLRQYVVESGPVTLARRAAGLMLSGMTTAEEIKRVVGWQ